MPAFVSMGEMGPILRLGLQDVLGRDRITVVADPDEADVALINLDSGMCREHAAVLLARFPGLTVIACSARRPAMVVLRAGMRGGERPLTAAALRATISASVARRLV